MITVRLWHATGHRGTAQLVQIHIHLLIHPCRFLLFLAWPKLLTSGSHSTIELGDIAVRASDSAVDGPPRISILAINKPALLRMLSVCTKGTRFAVWRRNITSKSPPRQPANHAMMMLARPSEEHVPRLAVLRFPNGRVSHAQLCTVIYQGAEACSSQQPAPAC